MVNNMNADINNLWLGRLQQELGVLSSNVMLLTLQRDALQEQIQTKAQLIEALKVRCSAAEQANAELREQIQPQLKSRQVKKQDPTGKVNGPHPAQPT